MAWPACCLKSIFKQKLPIKTNYFEIRKTECFSHFKPEIKDRWIHNVWILQFLVCCWSLPCFQVKPLWLPRCLWLWRDHFLRCGEAPGGSFWWPPQGQEQQTSAAHVLCSSPLQQPCGQCGASHTFSQSVSQPLGYPKHWGLTAGENHLFWVLNRLSAIRKKEKQWALQPCLPALPLVVTLPLARLSAWPLLTCGAFNKEREGSNFILSMRVIHVLKGDKNVIRKCSCQMCGKWNQFINAVKPTCEIGIKGEVRSHPCAYCGRMCARQRALVLGKGMLLLWPHAPADNKHSKFSSAQMHFKVLEWEMPRFKEQTLIMGDQAAAWSLQNIVRTPLKMLFFIS